MPNKPGKFLFLNDRDIYDGLMSAKQQVTTKMLREFFLEKGVFLSESLSREKLISYISVLNLDYHDIQLLIEQLTPNSRKEKVRFVDLECETTKSELREIINEVKEERSDNNEESYQPQIIGDENRLAINVEYDEIDLSKTRLRQRKPKESNLDIEVLPDKKVRIRFPDNSRSEDIAKSIQKKIKETKKVSLPESSIDLSEISCPKHRTSFFIKIISNMAGMQLENVTRVSVDSRLNTFDLYSDTSEEDDPENLDEEAIKGFVNKAVLSGSSVLTSEPYQELTKKSFYIYKLGWQMIETKVDGKKLEFEAFFSDAPDCRKFSCHVAGAYTPKNDGFTVSRRKLTSEDNNIYFSILESAACKAFQEIRAEYTAQTSTEKTEDEESNVAETS